ncbi:hypothetical protein M885DRAFT_513224 [Pelagophyceae sp. CCMP2097]|nr:hypothetical protein M885DRAFT_513224 [Pelagophyceae sp. CCMP2097]
MRRALAAAVWLLSLGGAAPSEAWRDDGPSGSEVPSSSVSPRRLAVSPVSTPLRLLYCITAYDRKQHVHLLQLFLSAVSMCEGGLQVEMILYTSDSNPYTTLQEAELRHIVQTCSGYSGGSIALEIRMCPAELKFEVTMLHRQDMLSRLDDFDVFVYAEDDVHVELRHVMAYYAASRKLEAVENGNKYVLGWQRFEKTGIGMGAEQVTWENNVDSWHAVEVGGELYLTMVNPHAGAWIAARDELKAMHAECAILRVTKTAGSFTRVRAGGWNMYLNCRRRKILPARHFAAFLVHHLPDKNWWTRSGCATTVPHLLAHMTDLVKRFDAGDRSMVCGDWWQDNFCRNELKVVRSAERKARFGVSGSCTVWRNVTDGREWVVQPDEDLKRAGAIVRAKEQAGKLALTQQKLELRASLQA